MPSENSASSTGEGEVFKAGFVVVDLETAMRDFSAWLGIEWTPVQQAPLTLAFPTGREEVSLRFTFSTRGPVLLELLEAQPSGYYAAPDGPFLHHVGRWVDDLAAASGRLEAAGLPREAAGVDAEGNTPALFAFHAGHHGLRVELVDNASRESFEGWLAGGKLELG